MRWYAVNVAVEHENLVPIPIGICNFADFDTLRKAIKTPLRKNINVYANYSTHTNRFERTKCMKHTRVANSPSKPFAEFLKDVKRAYFITSPEGNGIDCHRTWEALYLNSIPIVTKSVHTEHFRDFPLLILEDWKDFKKSYKQKVLQFNVG